MFYKNNSPSSLLRYFSPRIRNAFENSGILCSQTICEIRLCTNSPVALRDAEGGKFLNFDGNISSDENSAVICMREDIEYSFNAVCDNSIHSYERELREGFITVTGGHRVGISGTAVISGLGVKTIKNINSMNFRIARQVRGCSDRIYSEIFSDGLHGVLIAGAPSSGKTTVLRDLCRNLAGNYRVSVIDERSEIAAVYLGEPQNDIGPMSDIFDGYPKKEGIETAIRVMSPDVVICDEIGTKEDIKALIGTVNTGVKIIASVHAGDPEELYSRKNIMKLIKTGAFRYIVFLDAKDRTGNVVRTKDFILAHKE